MTMLNPLATAAPAAAALTTRWLQCRLGRRFFFCVWLLFVCVDCCILKGAQKTLLSSLAKLV